MTQAQISTLHPPEPIKMIMKAFLNIFCNSGQRTNEVRSKVQPYPPQISFINCFCTTVPIWLGWINSRGIISKRQTDWSMRDRSVSKIVQKHRGEGHYWFSQLWTKDRNWKKKHSRSELGCWQKWMDEVYKPVNAIRQELVLCLLSLIRPATQAAVTSLMFLFNMDSKSFRQRRCSYPTTVSAALSPSRKSRILLV